MNRFQKLEFKMSFTFFDILFTAILLIFAIIASSHGFLAELFSKLAIVLGLVVSFSFFGYLAPSLESFISNKALCTILAFFILFVATYLLVKIIQHLISTAFNGEIMKGLDRTLGFVLGALEGLVIVAVILIVVRAQPWFNWNIVTERSFYWELLGGLLDRPIIALNGMLV